MNPVSTSDFIEQARRKVPHFLFEYVDGGSYSQTTLRNNVRDLEDVALRQRVLKGNYSLDLSTSLFGKKQSLPVALGPIGLAGMYARRGEVQAARAAEKAGIPFALSTVSTCNLDEVCDAVSDPIWFQLYMIRDREFMSDLMSKVSEESNCSALIFTVDMPVPGARYRDYRSGLAGSPGFFGDMRRYWQSMKRPGWAWDVGLMGTPHHLGNVAPVLDGKTGLDDFFHWMKTNFDASASWDDIEVIRSKWEGPLIIKGILDAEDAKQAAALGVDGIVVSNHGGRQLDGVVSSVKALPEIAEAVGDALTVLVDGGVRSGLDIVRMLSLGADGVLLGRAWIYALAAGGQAGVEHLLTILEEEMKVAMTLTGVSNVSDIDRNCIR